MDLKVKDVAELLNISEITVRRWLAEGKIPSYKLDSQDLFSRAEIEDWLMQHKLDSALEKLPSAEEPSIKTSLQFSLYRALNRGEVLSQVPGTTKQDIFRSTMEHMATRFDLDPAVLTELFLDREQMMSTGLGLGIAVPHTRDFLLNTHYDVIEVVYPETPLDYDALDGQPVHTLFFLFACEDKSHLNLLAKLAHLSAREQARDFFRTRPSKEHLLDFVKQWETSLNS